MPGLSIDAADGLGGSRSRRLEYPHPSKKPRNKVTASAASRGTAELMIRHRHGPHVRERDDMPEMTYRDMCARWTGHNGACREALFR
jgi:hypothetical protein